MRTLIACILVLTGVAFLAGCSAAGVVMVSQPAEPHAINKGFFLPDQDLTGTGTNFEGLKHSGAPLLSPDSLTVGDGPSPHFPQRCQACHAAISDCALCHEEDAPRGGHPDILICIACHQPPRQADQGRLVWQDLRIDHSSKLLADCLACHADDAPANHFQIQCATCHAPPISGEEGGWANARVDHQAVKLTDCQSCHAQQQPGKHYSGQCSACHNTSAWSGASFSHQGASNCQGCHHPPQNHYGSECKLCHTPSKAWNKANFSWHKFDMDHGDANGNCSTCHTRSSTNCTSCHESEDGDDGDDGDDDD